MDHLHLQPKQTHGTDFARVRSWAVNGWAKYYRQTLVFSSLLLPPISALFGKKCSNYEGKVQVLNPRLTGTISRVVVKLPQVRKNESFFLGLKVIVFVLRIERRGQN